ncbi:BRO-N domain-containing protein [Pseudomonas juntendi]|uniref:BRO-N domain-containing protein n=1 Tax=Pseudomonas juntendi TaxID=2666183 RepID=UPI0035A22881
MSDNSTNVIPFNFGTQQVRTLLIDGEPWFVATDIAAVLQYRDSFNMCRNLDDEEKGTQIVSTPGGAQEMLAINESGLYSAILRSRKAEAKRFKKWVTSEVLPAIRKTGRYDDQQGRLATLIGQTIGTDGFHMLGAIVKGKVASLPAPVQRRATAKIWSQVHAAFGVRSAADIPAEHLDGARNFIASYAVLEGEFVPREPAPVQLPLNIYYPIEALAAIREGMLTVRNDKQAWLDVTLDDIRDTRDGTTPLESLLWDLEKAGFDIRGAWWELRTYRNKLREITSFVKGLGRVMEEPQRYAVDAPKGRAAA